MSSLIQHQAITLRLCARTTLFYTLNTSLLNKNIDHLTEEWLTTMLSQLYHGWYDVLARTDTTVF